MLYIIYNTLSLPLSSSLGQLSDGLLEESHVLISGKGSKVYVEILRRVPDELLGIVLGPARHIRQQLTDGGLGPAPAQVVCHVRYAHIESA